MRWPAPYSEALSDLAAPSVLVRRRRDERLPAPTMHDDVREAISHLIDSREIRPDSWQFMTTSETSW